jgi:dihydroxyacid dehydratase/phosphogluconate dehydratase
MGAASADIPAIMVPGGPMLAGQWRDQRLGSGTDGRKLFDLFRTGRSPKKSGAKSKAASRAAPATAP